MTANDQPLPQFGQSPEMWKNQWLMSGPQPPHPVDAEVERRALIWARSARMPHLGEAIRRELAALERSIGEPNCTSAHWANRVRHDVHRKHHLTAALAVLLNQSDSWANPDTEAVRRESAAAVIDAANREFGVAAILDAVHDRLNQLDRMRSHAHLNLPTAFNPGDYEKLIAGVRVHHSALMQVEDEHYRLMAAGDRLPAAMGRYMKDALDFCGGAEGVVASLTDYLLSEGHGREEITRIKGEMRATEDALEALGVDEGDEPWTARGKELAATKDRLSADLARAKGELRKNVAAQAAKVVRRACAGEMGQIRELARAAYHSPDLFPSALGSKIRGVGALAMKDCGLHEFGELDFAPRRFSISVPVEGSTQVLSYEAPPGSNTPVSV